MKFGLYTAAHQYTCQKRPGSYKHEKVDAWTYCKDYTIDYLKIDRCGGAAWPQANTSWILFHEGLTSCSAQTGRPVFVDVETCGSVTGCGQWVAGVANAWRIGPDIQANWASVMELTDLNNNLYPLAGAPLGILTPCYSLTSALITLHRITSHRLNRITSHHITSHSHCLISPTSPLSRVLPFNSPLSLRRSRALE